MHTCSLQPSDPHVSTHDTAMRCLEAAMTYDQLQCAELACLEIVMRQAQLAEAKYKEKFLGKVGIERFLVVREIPCIP